jgi:pullulanase
MRSMRSITSRLWWAAAASAVLLTGCGGGDTTSAPQTTVLANTATTIAAPLAPATVRMHFRRAQHDESSWGVYSWWGPVSPSPAWITGRFMMTSSDASAATSTSRRYQQRQHLVPGHRRLRQQELR